MSIRRTTIDRLTDARKSSRTTIGKGRPLDGRGDDGDLTFRRTSDGLKLYIKANGKWHGSKVGESFDDLEKIVNDLKRKVSTIKQFRLPSTYSVTGDFTLDSSGDINLDADGGEVYIKDGGTTFAYFSTASAYSSLTLYEDGGAGADYFQIYTGAAGVTTIRTIDAGGAAGHLTLVPDGNLTLDPASKVTIINESIVFNTQTHQDITSGGIAVDWNNGNKQSIDITGTGYTLTMTNPAGPSNLILKVIQGDGSDTITTWAASSGSVYWAGGAIPTLSTANGAIDIISLYFDGTNYFAVTSFNFATV